MTSDDTLNPLEAITPVDGRYRESLRECSRYFSEHALIRYRLFVEVRFLHAFLEAIGWRGDLLKLEALARNVLEMPVSDAEEVKQLEKKLGHDVAAATSYLEKRLDQLSLSELKPFIHFGLTSEDVNNIAYSLMAKSFINETYIPEMLKLVETLTDLAEKHRSTAFLARTHGQPAVPTTFGSYIANYAYRLASLVSKLKNIKLQAKLGGAVGDLSSLKTTYPEVDWLAFAERFVNSFGLEHTPASTQILPHERMSELLNTIASANTLTANLCRDMWILGSLGLVAFSKHAAEVHSSTMPQKRNPLLFENAEGALDLSTSMLSYMSTRLIASRLHRDLSDSIIKRFYGTALALSLLGVKNTHRALGEVYVNTEAMRKEVETHKHAVMLEAVQLMLRKHGVEDGYRIAAEAAEKGFEWLEQQLKKLGKDPTTIIKTTDHYIQAAAEKTTFLLNKTRNILSYLGNQLPR
ncbi:MAG: lyase family protein [Candidatus Caldarchaeum sp.]